MYLGLSGNKPFQKKDKMLALIGLTATHLQFLFGLFLYFVSPMGFKNLSGATMGDSMGRLYTLEHPLMMLIAVILITIGYSKHKKLAEDKRKFKTVFIFYLIGLILILSRIPWTAWLGN
jgi:uncharacterized membrane protein